MPQFFITRDSILENEVSITGSDSYHLTRVRRIKPGNTVILRDEDGKGYLAKVTKVSSDEIRTVIINEFMQDKTLPDITLYMALLKGGNFEFVIQKTVEVGVNRIVPVVTERTVPVPEKMSENKIERWNKIASEACKQCLRSTPVLIEHPIVFNEALLEEGHGSKIICHPGTDSQLKHFLENCASRKSVSVLIGPEGGFSNDEISEARNAGWSVVSLGENHLRAETAALIIPAAIIYEWS